MTKIWTPPNKHTKLRDRRTKGKNTFLKGKHREFSDITKEWVGLIPKTINNNYCWIPLIVPSNIGYCYISIKGVLYSLHRIVMCIHNDIDYYDKKIVTRHNEGCEKACFNPEHLQPGTDMENVRDNVIRGVHKESKKKVCPKCGGPYRTTTYRTGFNIGKTVRHCAVCKEARRLERKRVAI